MSEMSMCNIKTKFQFIDKKMQLVIEPELSINTTT